MKYGSFGLRFLAWMFDVLLIWLVPVLVLLTSVLTAQTTADFWIGSLWIVWIVFFCEWMLMLVYRIYTLMRFKASFGKMVAGLAIEKEDGSEVTLTDAFLRFPVGYMVSSLLWGLGFFWILRDSKRRGFHDQIAGTVVVKKASARQLFIVLPIMLAIYILIFYAIIKMGIERGLWDHLAADLQNFWQQMGDLTK